MVKIITNICFYVFQLTLNSDSSKWLVPNNGRQKRPDCSGLSRYLNKVIVNQLSLSYEF